MVLEYETYCLWLRIERGKIIDNDNLNSAAKNAGKYIIWDDINLEAMSSE